MVTHTFHPRTQKVGKLISVSSRPHGANLQYKSQDTEAWVGEAISKDLKRHQDVKCLNCDDIEVWVGKAISRGFKSHRSTKRFNCGRIGHVSRNCRQSIPTNNDAPGNDSNRRP